MFLSPIRVLPFLFSTDESIHPDFLVLFLLITSERDVSVAGTIHHLLCMDLSIYLWPGLD